jgi:hypothetical protein
MFRRCAPATAPRQIPRDLAASGSPRFNGSLRRGADGKKIAPRHSGAQLEVLATYRALLREARRKSDPAARENLLAHIRAEYRDHMAISRKATSVIEWHVHNARNRLEELSLQKPTVGFSTFTFSPK